VLSRNCNVLILGGDASLAQPILESRFPLGLSITATSRKSGKSDSADLKWLYLDLSDSSSIQSFASKIGESRFQLIAFFVGAPSKEQINPSVYVETHFTNTVGLLRQVMTWLDPNSESTLVFLSSRSAIYSSRDVLYSGVKAGVSAAVKSLSALAPSGSKLFSIAPGLILGSKMAENMPKTLQLDHLTRAHGNLLTTESFSRQLLELLSDTSEIENGSLVEIGPSYK
jgi:nucleoside-diphosphate-sugar epimerase